MLFNHQNNYVVRSSWLLKLFAALLSFLGYFLGYFNKIVLFKCFSNNIWKLFYMIHTSIQLICAHECIYVIYVTNCKGKEHLSFTTLCIWNLIVNCAQRGTKYTHIHRCNIARDVRWVFRGVLGGITAERDVSVFRVSPCFDTAV